MLPIDAIGYASNGMSFDAQGYSNTWLMVINALMQRYLNKNMSQKGCDLGHRASQRSDGVELEFGTRFSKTTRECRRMCTSMKKVKYYIRGLKPFIRIEMLG